MTDDRSHFMGFFFKQRQPRSQGLSSSRPRERAPGGGKMRDPGNEVETETAKNHT